MSDEDPRVSRLPLWARTLIREQDDTIEALKRDVSDLKDNADGFIAAPEDCDTVRVSDRTVMADGSDVPDMGLGNGAVIRFADFYEAHYGDVGNGARALIVETDFPLAVVPVHQTRVIIRRA
jgi:hypothetical protein